MIWGVNNPFEMVLRPTTAAWSNLDSHSKSHVNKNITPKVNKHRDNDALRLQHRLAEQGTHEAIKYRTWQPDGMSP